MLPPMQWDRLDLDQAFMLAQKLRSDCVASFCLASAVGGGGLRSVLRPFREMRRRRKDGRLVLPPSNAFRTLRLSTFVRETWLQAVPLGFRSRRAISCFASSPSIGAPALDHSQLRAWRTSFARTGFSSTQRRTSSRCDSDTGRKRTDSAKAGRCDSANVPSSHFSPRKAITSAVYDRRIGGVSST
jgi:hypothetical protein